MMKIFISHASRDKQTILNIIKELPTPIRNWFDQYQISAGDIIRDSLMDGINKSDLFLLFISPEAIESPWVKKEIEWALKRERENPLYKSFKLNFLIPIKMGKIDNGKYNEFFKDAEDRKFIELKGYDDSDIKNCAKKLEEEINHWSYNFFQKTKENRETIQSSASSNTSIAVDSTLLLAADSFLLPEGSDRDPEADIAFEFVVNAFCNLPTLFLSKPKTQPTKLTPLLSLYYEEAQGEHNAIDLSPAADRSLAKDFRRVRSSDVGFEIADWVRFQFSDPRFVEIFWGGGNRIESLVHSYDILKGLPKDDHSPNPLMRSLLDQPPKIHESMQATLSKLPGPTELAEAYAFLAFFKGYRYAVEIPSGIPYHCHWLREEALPPPEYPPAIVANANRGLMPWGGIIIDLVDKDSPLRLYREEDRFTYGLRSLRKYVRDYSPPKRSLEEVTDFVINGLIEAKLIDNQIITAHYYSKIAKYNEYRLPEIEKVRCRLIGEEHTRDYLRTRKSIKDRLKRSLLKI